MKEEQDLSTEERTAHMKAALYDALKWQHWLNGKADAAAIAGRYEPPTSQPWRRRFKCASMLHSAPLRCSLLRSPVLCCSALLCSALPCAKRKASAAWRQKELFMTPVSLTCGVKSCLYAEAESHPFAEYACD